MNILILTNSTHGYYGYSIVTKHIAKGLRDAGHDVKILGMQTLGRGIPDDLENVNIPIRYDAFGSDSLNHYMRAYWSDLFISILDVWLPQTAYIPQLTQQMRIPWICHVTINSEPLSPYLHARIAGASKIVAPSKWNLEVLQGAGLGQLSAYIPHGVDPKLFHPLKDNEKQEIKEGWGLDVPFIFGTVQRNKGPQKNFFGLFHAYKMLVEKNQEIKENTKMVILADPFEPDGIKLQDLVNRIGLQNHIRFIRCLPAEDPMYLKIAHIDDPNAFYHHANFGLCETEMNKLFNVFDCHVIPSQGESASLPLIEAMACGVPNIFPAFSVGPEHLILDDPTPRGLLVDNVRDRSGEPAFINTPLLSQIANPSPEHMADCMLKMYKDELFRAECSQKGLEFVTRYHWDKVTPKWVELVKLFDRPKITNYMTGELGL